MANITPIKKTVTTETNEFGWFDFFGLKRANITPGVLSCSSFGEYAANALNSQGYHEASISAPTVDGRIPESLKRYVSEAQAEGMTPFIVPEKNRGDIVLSDFESHQHFSQGNPDVTKHASRYFDSASNLELVKVHVGNSNDSDLSGLVNNWYEIYKSQGENNPFFRNAFSAREHDLDSLYLEQEPSGKTKERFGLYLMLDGRMIAGSINYIMNKGKKISESYRAVDPSMKQSNLPIDAIMTDALIREVYANHPEAEVIGAGMDTNRYGHHLGKSVWNSKTSFEIIPHKTDDARKGMRVVVPNIDFNARYEREDGELVKTFGDDMVIYPGVPLDQMHLPVAEAELAANVIVKDYEAVGRPERFMNQMHRKGISRVQVYSQQEPGVLKLETMKYFSK